MRAPLRTVLARALLLALVSGCAGCHDPAARTQRASASLDAAAPGLAAPALVEAPEPARCAKEWVTAVGWPAIPSGPAVLTIHVTQLAPGQVATVGWASLDSRRMGVLNVVYGAAVPTYQANVPSERLQLYVDGLSANEGRAAHAQVDLRKRKSAALTIALAEPRQVLLRRVVIRDREGKHITGVRGLPVLDGSVTALHNATANFEQWISDANGELVVRSIAAEPVKIALTVPLLARPIERTLMPDEQELRLDAVTTVRCSFRCPATGKATPWPGYWALAELSDGTCNRFEIEESDALASGDIMFAWPEGTRKLTVSSSPYLSTTITSPDQRCELHPRPERQCAFWD